VRDLNEKQSQDDKKRLHGTHGLESEMRNNAGLEKMPGDEGACLGDSAKGTGALLIAALQIRRFSL